MDKSNSFWAQDIVPILNQSCANINICWHNKGTEKGQVQYKHNTKQNVPIKHETSSQRWSNTLSQHRPNVSRLRDIDVF